MQVVKIAAPIKVYGNTVQALLDTKPVKYQIATNGINADNVAFI